jgi:hypothetical protein
MNATLLVIVIAILSAVLFSKQLTGVLLTVTDWLQRGTDALMDKTITRDLTPERIEKIRSRSEHDFLFIRGVVAKRANGRHLTGSEITRYIEILKTNK